MGIPDKFTKEKATKAEEIKKLSKSKVYCTTDGLGGDSTWTYIIYAYCMHLLLAAFQDRIQG